MQKLYTMTHGTEVDAEIFSNLVRQGNVVLTVFSTVGCKGRYNQVLYTLRNKIIYTFSILLEFSDCSLSSASEMSDSSFSSSVSTAIVDEVPSKRQRIEDAHVVMSARQTVTKLDSHEFLNTHFFTPSL